MDAVFADSAELSAVLEGVLSRFLASEDGARIAAAAAGLGDSAVLEVCAVDPEAVVCVDFARRALVEAKDNPPAASATIDASSLHHLLMDQLGPVEISRLAEEQRATLTGPPLVLGALLPVVAAIQPHYRQFLEGSEWAYLVDAPAPATGEIWESTAEPVPVIGVRRAWQRPRGRTVAS